jgi:hypothetical protein
MPTNCTDVNVEYTVQLHNSLIISLFDITSHLKAQPPPPSTPVKPRPQKRRRTLPYRPSDLSDPNTLRSARLKKWTLGVGKRERERLKGLENMALGIDRPLVSIQDEICQERGVMLLPERGGRWKLLMSGRCFTDPSI